MKNFDKSLTEVWEWKDKVYQEAKNLAPEDYVKKIKDVAERELETNAITLQSIHKEKQPV